MVERDSVGNLIKDGEVISVPYKRKTVKMAVSMVHGRVLEIGLGLGQTRDELLEATNVHSVRTLETEQEVVDSYKGDKDGIEIADVRVFLQKSKEMFDSVLIDLDPTPVASEEIFQKGLKSKFKELGSRTVVITEDLSLELSGFVRGLSERTDDERWILVFDRFEPEVGIGVRDPHGKNYLPGYGWQGGDNADR